MDECAQFESGVTDFRPGSSMIQAYWLEKLACCQMSKKRRQRPRIFLFSIKTLIARTSLDRASYRCNWCVRIRTMPPT